MRLSDASTSEQQTSFVGQLPDSPGLYDAQSTGQGGVSVTSIPLIWREPAAGVTSATGVLLCGTGVALESDTTRQYIPLDDSWCDTKNLIIATVAQRNLAFAPPADHVKLQISDALRALGKLQQLYPQYNRRRQYWFGGSGAGWLAMQLACYCPEQFAEIHSHAGIMKLTTPADQQTSYTADPPGGWNVNSGFPTSHGSLQDWEWARYQAERELRGPIFTLNYTDAMKRLYSATSSDPPLILMSHGNADATVSFYHFISMRNALQSFAGHSVIVTKTPEWGSVTSLGNWTFVEIYNGTHNYDRVFISAYTDDQCFTREKLTMPPTQLSYTSPISHGYVFRLSGSTVDAEIHTVNVTSATDWHLFE